MQSPLAMTSSGRVLGLDPVCGLKFPVFPTMWDSASTTLSRGGVREGLEKQLWKSLRVTGDKPSWTVSGTCGFSRQGGKEGQVQL